MREQRGERGDAPFVEGISPLLFLDPPATILVVLLPHLRCAFPLPATPLSPIVVSHARMRACMYRLYVSFLRTG